MTNPDPSEPTRLLRAIREGDTDAEEALLPLVYDELHRLAEMFMAGERSGHTLQPTALLNEAWMRMADPMAAGLDDRRHFFRTAARAMRRALVDHARARKAEKRGAGRTGTALDAIVARYEENTLDLLALHESLELLGRRDAELANLVELRFFGGLSNAETAEVLGCSSRTVERGWVTARAWLLRRLRTDLEQSA